MSISLDSITFPSISGIDDNSGMPVTASPANASLVGSATTVAPTETAATTTTATPATATTATPATATANKNAPSFEQINGAIPLALVVIVIILIAYYVLFASLGNDTSTSETSAGTSKLIEILLWGLFIMLILFNGMAYIFNIDVIASVKNIFSPVTNIDIKIKEKGSGTDAVPSSLERKKQVFHVSDNKYNYQDAKAICSAYDGRLATYNELNQAYNDGADWCGYGWSDNQMALFPTQEEKWNKLQTIDGHHHDCGRPGINGGFIDNPNVHFGVNCYGYKPDITSKEAEQMSNQQLYPKNKKEIMFDKKVDYWRTKLSDIMISPFNSDNWSII